MWVLIILTWNIGLAQFDKTEKVCKWLSNTKQKVLLSNCMDTTKVIYEDCISDDRYQEIINFTWDLYWVKAGDRPLLVWAKYIY